MRYVDPPSGWKYGFPMAIPDDVTDITGWIIEQGYPRELVESYGEYFFLRFWESDKGEEVDI